MFIFDLLFSEASGFEGLLEFLVPCLGFTFLILGAVTYAIWYEKRRTVAWKAEAEALGFSFAKNDMATRNKLTHFPVFSKGTKRKLFFVIKGESQGTKMILGDYSFARVKVNSSDTQSEMTQTICAILNKDLNLPHFYLRKEGLFHNFFNDSDIDFDDDPEFSKAFTLESETPDLAKKLFSFEIRNFFLEHKGTPWQVEAIGPAIVVHRGKSIKPSQTRELMEFTYSILELLLAQDPIEMDKSQDVFQRFVKKDESDFWSV